ncbi:tetratricopeptide repeat protein [Jejuia pallidilutea]|uniref:Tetratricopeptide repeat protein n=1 Tax=Jejuia pallidilutea TaxID=504487 RepID=A0A362X0C1_9FLAO|nr:tetratricopeptide repeat protein [Jejuia pallidilutea]PQV46317.1 tetratricopeptide repeat protein [Jejuia pallidilutea]
MKKQFIIALAISISAFSFAQKKELRAVEKAIKDNNFSEAKAALAVVEPMLGSLDEKLMDKYNYLKGVALYAGGAGSNADMDAAVEYLNKAEDAYKVEVTQLKGDMVNKLLEKGNKAYEGKKFGAASEYFEKVYNMRKKDTVYLYYAAATAVNEPDYDRALVLYQKLKDLEYTGIEEKLYAVNVATNEKEVFPSEALRKASVSAKTHMNPTNEKSDSKRGEIVKNVALIYISKGDNDKAIQAIKDARAEDPDDVNLILSEANIYYKMGDTEKFKELLEIATEKDPGNAELQYNLGVISAESDHPEEAMGYYKKAIELDPNYVNAYINSAALVLGREEALIKEMNGLGTSAADDKRYEQLRKERQDLYREAVPYLSKALEINPKSQSAATTLMNIYSVLGETDKYKAMKAKVEAMGAGQ